MIWDIVMIRGDKYTNSNSSPGKLEDRQLFLFILIYAIKGMNQNRYTSSAEGNRLCTRANLLDRVNERTSIKFCRSSEINNIRFNIRASSRMLRQWRIFLVAPERQSKPTYTAPGRIHNDSILPDHDGIMLLNKQYTLKIFTLDCSRSVGWYRWECCMFATYTSSYQGFSRDVFSPVRMSVNHQKIRSTTSIRNNSVAVRKKVISPFLGKTSQIDSLILRHITLLLKSFLP